MHVSPLIIEPLRDYSVRCAEERFVKNPYGGEVQNQ